MSNRAFTLSLVLAGIAVFMVYSYLSGVEASYVEKYGDMVPVVVAKEDIKALELIDDRKVQTMNVPKKYLAPGYFKRIEDVYNTIAAVPILKGEQITQPRLTYPGSASGLSRQVSIGKRALSIKVAEHQAVSKLIKPGDRVDVIALIDYAADQKELMKVKTVLQDVLVLATGLSVTNSIPLVGYRVDKEIKKLNLENYTSFNTITMELTPSEVQKMIYLTETSSSIYMSLRNNDDNSKESLAGTRLYDVLDEDAAAAKAYFSLKEQIRNKQRRGKR